MKHLSLVLATIVLVISTLSYSMEDGCLKFSQHNTNNQQDSDDDCGIENCSPFSNCNTCVGFVLNSWYAPIVNSISIPGKKIIVLHISIVSFFSYSIWNPPQ